MYKLFLFSLLTISSHQEKSSKSPDGRFTLNVEVKEEEDLQKRYITRLTDNTTKETKEIANCIRRDLSPPSFYWDKDSQYLIFEKCTESFEDSRISILNLMTRKTEIELTGLIGNQDDTAQQFDIQNSILFYFDTSAENKGKIPALWTFDLKTKGKKKLFQFDVNFDMDFPEIRRIENRRQIMITYFDVVSGQRFIKKVAY